MITIKVNGKQYNVEPNQTILSACKSINVDIPTLCYLKEFSPSSSCRICLVEIVGARSLVPSCSVNVTDGMEIFTESEKVVKARKLNLELLLSNHNYDCINCIRNNTCELQYLAKKYNCDENKFAGEKLQSNIDLSNPSIVRDNSKCILCKRCINACNIRQQVNAINQNERGFKSRVGCAYNEQLVNSTCVRCGQCILACPTGALYERSEIDKTISALNDKSKFVVIAPAPSVRVGIGEEFGESLGIDKENVLPTALRKLGFDKVFDIDFAADLTIVEESKELIERLTSGKNIPMFTSCCPAWIEYVHKFYPEFEPNVSTCKSPQQMFGAVAKTYLAEKLNINPQNIMVVSVMPCTAKKSEKELSYNISNNIPDIDISITVRELASLLKSKHINLKTLSPSKFDKLLGESTGAGVIFGATGGVMEAALRTAADILENKDLPVVDFISIRGDANYKKAKVSIVGKELNIAVVNGLSATRELLEKIKTGAEKYHFVEVMSCPGGCINGGGMPRKTANELNGTSIIRPRIESLYKNDKAKLIRKSHLNPEIIEFYKWQNNSKIKAKLHVHH